MTPRRCRAVIFDLDGTLIDSLDDIAGALGGALDDAGLQVPARDEVRAWVGDGARNLCTRAVHAAGGAPELVETVHARFAARYRSVPVHHTKLYPGVSGLLDVLTASGRALGVLSNKPHDLTLTICDRLLAEWPFAAIAGQRPGVPLKPDPEAAIVMAMELGVEPHDCILVGDSPMDLGCARGAEMRSVGVTWGLRPREELVGADHLIDKPLDLLALTES
jgi:phosphoglycolate phosphatase